jgi:nucleoside-specific outer membrane channel protein Tsx
MTFFLKKKSTMTFTKVGMIVTSHSTIHPNIHDHDHLEKKDCPCNVVMDFYPFVDH